APRLRRGSPCRVFARRPPGSRPRGSRAPGYRPHHPRPRPPGSRPRRPRRPALPLRRSLGAGLAAGDPGRPVTVRPAGDAGALVARMTERMAPAGSRPAIGDVLAAFASGVTLVTVADGRDDVGTTVSAFCPVSGEPPLVLVS